MGTWLTLSPPPAVIFFQRIQRPALRPIVPPKNFAFFFTRRRLFDSFGWNWSTDVGRLHHFRHIGFVEMSTPLHCVHRPVASFRGDEQKFDTEHSNNEEHAAQQRECWTAKCE